MNTLFTIGKLSIGSISLIISIILFIGTVVLALSMGYLPRIRKTKIEELKQEVENTKKELKRRDIELIDLYNDVYQLIQVEKFLTEDAETSKIKAREGFTISTKCGKKHIENRINSLNEELKLL